MSSKRLRPLTLNQETAGSIPAIPTIPVLIVVCSGSAVYAERGSGSYPVVRWGLTPLRATNSGRLAQWQRSGLTSRRLRVRVPDRPPSQFALAVSPGTPSLLSFEAEMATSPALVARRGSLLRDFAGRPVMRSALAQAGLASLPLAERLA